MQVYLYFYVGFYNIVYLFIVQVFVQTSLSFLLEYKIVYFEWRIVLRVSLKGGLMLNFLLLTCCSGETKDTQKEKFVLFS